MQVNFSAAPSEASHSLGCYSSEHRGPCGTSEIQPASPRSPEHGNPIGGDAPQISGSGNLLDGARCGVEVPGRCIRMKRGRHLSSRDRDCGFGAASTAATASADTPASPASPSESAGMPALWNGQVSGVLSDRVKLSQNLLGHAANQYSAQS